VQNLSRGGLRCLASCLVQTEGFEQLGPFGAETHMRPKGADRVSFIFSWDNDDVKTEETRRTLPVCFRPLLLRCQRCLRSRKPKAYLDRRPPVLSRGHMNPSTRWAPNCWCKLGPKGSPTPQYSSPPRGKEPKNPFRGLHLLLPLLLALLLLQLSLLLIPLQSSK
jgi:hypothetical protein